MTKKSKLKDLEANQTFTTTDGGNPSNNTRPNPSNIFDQLFGQTPQNEPSSASPFSSHNPFRRKPIQSSLSQPEPVGATPIPQPRSPSGACTDVKKRKKREDKSSDFDTDVEINSSLDAVKGGKKAKRKKGEEAELDSEKGNRRIPDLGNLKIDGEAGKLNTKFEDSGGERSDGKRLEKEKNKKRKRDDLEREYEERRFGGELGNRGGGEKDEKLVGKKRKAADDPEQMKVTNDGYDNEEKLLRTVFVGNLPLKVKKKALLRDFSRFGDIESVRIRSVPTLDVKKPKKVKVILNQLNEAADSVHAYVVFKTELAAESSLAHNMALFEGNHIRVDRACPPRKKLKGDNAPLYDPKRTLFVGNLPFNVKDEELYQLFSGMSRLESSVEAIRVVRDSHTNFGKGIAYVLFKTREVANSVAKRKDLKLRDRELRITHARSNSTPAKRKSSSLGWTENSPSKNSRTNSKSPDSGDLKWKVKADTSYQGLRASKSVGNKVTTKTIKPVNVYSGTQAVETVKQRKQKRPAVAARKAKILAKKELNPGVVSKQAGQKRKMESRTPQSCHLKKKLKNSK